MNGLRPPTFIDIILLTLRYAPSRSRNNATGWPINIIVILREWVWTLSLLYRFQLRFHSNVIALVQCAQGLAGFQGRKWFANILPIPASSESRCLSNILRELRQIKSHKYRYYKHLLDISSLRHYSKKSKFRGSSSNIFIPVDLSVVSSNIRPEAQISPLPAIVIPIWIWRLSPGTSSTTSAFVQSLIPLIFLPYIESYSNNSRQSPSTLMVNAAEPSGASALMTAENFMRLPRYWSALNVCDKVAVRAKGG